MRGTGLGDKRKPWARIFVLLIILSSLSLYAESTAPLITVDQNSYVSLHEFKNSLPFSTSYDIITGRGRLFFRNHSAVYMIGASVFIVDGKLHVAGRPVMRKNGLVLLPLDMVTTISRTVHSMEARDKGNRVVFVPVKNQAGTVTTRVKPGHEPITFFVIDPGHGGKDPGAIGKGKMREKDLTLELAKRLASELKRTFPGKKIYLTRNRDRFITLLKRTEIANRHLKRNQNGVFISIHGNASISSRISGFETYYLSQNPSNEAARKTAALENNVIVLEDHKGKGKYNQVEYIEAMMITTQIQKESSQLAEDIQKGLDRTISRFKSRGVRRADFYVLRGVLMPAVLVEVGFVTNSKESRYLRTRAHQQRIVRGIVQGLKNFIYRYNRTIR